MGGTFNQPNVGRDINYHEQNCYSEIEREVLEAIPVKVVKEEAPEEIKDEILEALEKLTGDRVVGAVQLSMLAVKWIKRNSSKFPKMTPEYMKLIEGKQK